MFGMDHYLGMDPYEEMYLSVLDQLVASNRRDQYNRMHRYHSDVFEEHAIVWTSASGNAYQVDVRPRATLKFGFRPNERVITPRGLATVIGVSSSRLLFQPIDSDAPPFLGPAKKELYKAEGYHPIRTEKDKDFIDVAVKHVERKSGRGYEVTIYADIRPEATQALGFTPGEHVITPKNGVATVIGMLIDGRVYFEVVKRPTALATLLWTHISALTTKEAHVHAGYYPIRTQKDKDFLAAATERRHHKGHRIIVDARVETLQRHGFSRPNEPLIIHVGAAASPKVVFVVGVDIFGNVHCSLRAELVAIDDDTYRIENYIYDYADTRITGRLPFNTMDGLIRNGVIKTSRPSSTKYTGANNMAGRRHGKGVMTCSSAPVDSPSSSSSWRYKGQWQQGLPHGSGTMRMTIKQAATMTTTLMSSFSTGNERLLRQCLSRGGSMVAVYEGRWVYGVPHGAGTLSVTTTTRRKRCEEDEREEEGEDSRCLRRRYCGRWVKGRRVMTALEIASLRLSGGLSLRLQPNRHRLSPPRPNTTTTPKQKKAPQINMKTKNTKSTKHEKGRKTVVPVAVSKHPVVHTLTMTTHSEVEWMVAALAAACCVDTHKTPCVIAWLSSCRPLSTVTTRALASTSALASKSASSSRNHWCTKRSGGKKYWRKRNACRRWWDADGSRRP